MARACPFHYPCIRIHFQWSHNAKRSTRTFISPSGEFGRLFSTPSIFQSRAQSLLRRLSGMIQIEVDATRLLSVSHKFSTQPFAFSQNASTSSTSSNKKDLNWYSCVSDKLNFIECLVAVSVKCGCFDNKHFVFYSTHILRYTLVSTKDKERKKKK